MKQFENIPEELKELPQCVCRKEKISFNPISKLPEKAGQPASRASFEDAVNVFHGGGYDGIGFEFNNNGIMGIDLDRVIADDGSSGETIRIKLELYMLMMNQKKGKKCFISTY